MPDTEVTQLLRRWSHGDSSALEQLTPLVYVELRKLAHAFLRKERPGHTLQSTAVVHEVFLKLVAQKQAQWQDHAHFLAVSSQIIRRILVDYARAHQREKRGAGVQHLPLQEALHTPEPHSNDLVVLDDALNTLAKLDPQQSRVVELRYFGGLSVEETAQALGISRATVNRDWVTARAFLLRELKR